MPFLQATWPTFCKGPSLTTDTMRTLWSVNRRNERRGLLAFCNPVCVSFLVELRDVCIAFLEAETKDRPSWHLLARLSCRMPSFCQLFSSWGWKLFFLFVCLCGRSWLGRRAVCGEGSPETPFLDNPWTVSHSHWFWDIWIIPQVLNRRTVFVLLNI